MKKLYFLSVALCVLISVNAQPEISCSTDTIHKHITDFQSDSLIKANTANPGFYILDVRTPTEFCCGHLVNANNIDYRATGFWDVLATLDRNIIYLLHCKGGTRSLPTFNKMISMHFREVYMMIGGFDQWKLDGLPYVTGTVSNIDELMVSAGELNIYPSPANSKLTIEIKSPIKTSTLSVINTNGQELITLQTTDKKLIIDIGLLPPCAYIVKLQNANGIEVRKFIKD